MQKLQAELKFSAVYLSKTQIQQDNKAIVSCGPLCLELLRHWQKNPPNLSDPAFNNKPEQKEGFTYRPIDIHLSESLSQVKRSNNKKEAMREAMRNLRKTHAELLKSDTEEAVSSDKDFWHHACDNAPLQVLMRRLLNKELNYLTITTDAEYKALQEATLAKEPIKLMETKPNHEAIDYRKVSFTQQEVSSIQAALAKINNSQAKILSEQLVSEKKCLWVPASLRHNEPGVSNNRHTFFCYGGVSLQANIRAVNQVLTSPQSRSLPPGGGSGGSGGGTGGGGSGSGSGGSGGGYNNRKAMLNQAGFQDHHIISPTNRHTKNHELFQLAGVDPNARVNRIFLPTRPDLHPTRSVHMGKHVDSYSRDLNESMRGIIMQGKSSGWNQQQYEKALRGLITQYRQELREGNIALNCNNRPWSQ